MRSVPTLSSSARAAGSSYSPPTPTPRTVAACSRVQRSVATKFQHSRTRRPSQRGRTWVPRASCASCPPRSSPWVECSGTSSGLWACTTSRTRSCSRRRSSWCVDDATRPPRKTTTRAGPLRADGPRHGHRHAHGPASPVGVLPGRGRQRLRRRPERGHERDLLRPGASSGSNIFTAPSVAFDDAVDATPSPRVRVGSMT